MSPSTKISESTKSRRRTKNKDAKDMKSPKGIRSNDDEKINPPKNAKTKSSNDQSFTKRSKSESVTKSTKSKLNPSSTSDKGSKDINPKNTDTSSSPTKSSKNSKSEDPKSQKSTKSKDAKDAKDAKSSKRVKSSDEIKTNPSKLSKPSSTPSQISSYLPSEDQSSFPSAISSTHPSILPTKLPQKSPSSKPSHLPSDDPSSASSALPSSYPTISTPMSVSNSTLLVASLIPSHLPSNDPSSVPTSHPSTHPTASLSNYPSTILSSKPSHLPSEDPSSTPSTLPSHHPSMLPSTFPSISPSSILSSDPCQLSTTGFFGLNTTNAISVRYNYKMEYLESFNVSEILKDLEYAIGALIIESVFSECSTSRMLQETGQFELESLIKGISSTPKDIAVDKCEPSLPAPNDDKDGNTDNDCDLIDGSISLYLQDNERGLQLSSEIETEVLNFIRDGMDNDELVLSHSAIVNLTYIPNDDQTIALVNNIEQVRMLSSIGLISISCAALFFLIVIGYIRRRVSKTKCSEDFAEDSDTTYESIEQT